MHKMLEVYLNDYLNDITREKKLMKIKEYEEIQKELNELHDEIIKLLEKEIGHDVAYDFIFKLDELNWYITEYEIKDAFEYGFNAGLQIGVNACKKVDVEEE